MKRIRIPEQPSYYVLRDIKGRLVDQGEERTAEFCIRAREMGPHAQVEEIQHPDKPGTPFGFHYIVTEPELREMAARWAGVPNAPEHCARIAKAWG